MWKIAKQIDTRYLIVSQDGAEKGEVVAVGARWRANLFGVPDLKREWPTTAEAFAYVRGIEALVAIYGKEMGLPAADLAVAGLAR